MDSVFCVVILAHNMFLLWHEIFPGIECIEGMRIPSVSDATHFVVLGKILKIDLAYFICKHW